jgi:WD40 repeat protein
LNWGDQARYEKRLADPEFMTPQPYWEMHVPLLRMIAAREGGKVVLARGTAEGTVLEQWELLPSEARAAGVLRVPHVLKLRAVAPDGNQLVLESDHRVLVVIDSATGNNIDQLAGFPDELREVAFTPNGRVLVVLSADGTLHVWAVGTGQTVSTKLDGEVALKAIPADSRHLALSTDQGLLIIGLSRDAIGSSIDVHRSKVVDVTVSPDGRRVASASEDRTIKVWDLGNGEQLASATLDHPAQKVAFAINGTAVVAGDSAGNVRCLVIREPSANVSS